MQVTIYYKEGNQLREAEVDSKQPMLPSDLRMNPDIPVMMSDGEAEMPLVRQRRGNPQPCDERFEEGNLTPEDGTESSP